MAIWNQSEKSMLAVGRMLHLQCTKATLVTNTKSIEETLHANGICNNSCGRVETSGHVISPCKQGLLKEALYLLHAAHRRGIRLHSSTYTSLLQECANKKALPEGKLLHAQMIYRGFYPDVFVGNCLVIMYAKCGSLMDARRALEEIPKRNVVSWTAMIAACTRNGRNDEALTLYYLMRREGIQPNEFTFACVLPACANMAALEHGKAVHADIMTGGFQADVFVGSALVDMYFKCGMFESACQVFDEMPERNVVSWTAMIAGYAQNEQVDEALKLFQKMPDRDPVSWTAIIVGYADSGQLDEAMKLFNRMPERDEISWNAMVGGYAQNGRLDEAIKLFQKMPKRDVVSWNVMTAGYAQNENFNGALELFHQMKLAMAKLESVTFTTVLSVCANLATLGCGREIHENIIIRGFQSHVSVGNALIDMYSKCGSMQDARQVFDEMPERDVVTWNEMIAGYAQNGQVDETLKLFQKMPEKDVVSWTAMIVGYTQNGQVNLASKLFQEMPERDVVSCNAMIAGYAHNGYFNEALKLSRQMQLTGVNPDSVPFTSILAACANLAALINIKEVHGSLIRSGFQTHTSLGNSLIDAYAKCGGIEDASKVFDGMLERDTVSWNAMLGVYAQNGQFDEARNLFLKMPERDAISWTAMITAYALNGQVDEALQLFQKMPEFDAVSWNAMVAGYTQNGHFNEALKLFGQMRLTGTMPDSITFTSILTACGNLAALTTGKEVHENIIRTGFQSHLPVGNTLVDMYAKSGTIQDARRVFDEMPERDIVSWNVMIVGYASHGCGREALQLFEEMQHFGTMPNHITFIGVLSACSHAGLVDDGCQYFDCMMRDYHITPVVKHYCCMVDLLGRAGYLNEAQDFINKMPVKPNAAVWGSLLGACRVHTNLDLGERVAERLFELDPNNAGCYVLLSNMYAAAGRWDEVEKVRKFMKHRRVKKTPGCSWIEVNNKVYSFLVTDRSNLRYP